MSSLEYNFTNNWFDVVAKPNWDSLIPLLNPTRILEIGSFEGASTCYLINKLALFKDVEIHCVDTWEGGIEHQELGGSATNMSAVEMRFKNNTKKAIQEAKNKVELTIHKGFSDMILSKLLSDGKQNYFDFVYVDGSHQSPDVLCDALLSFRLLNIKGLIAFDDYLWQEDLSYGVDPIRCPKPAIDAFTNIYCRKLKIIRAPLYQLYVEKLSN